MPRSVYYLLVAALPLVFGCGGPKEQFTIVVIPKGLTHEHWQSVRRGAERVGAAGAAAPDFRFAALYGWQRWEQGALVAMPPRAVPLTTPAPTLFA